MAGLEFAFECLKKCISIEKDSVWHTSKSDPIAALLLDLESSENVADELTNLKKQQDSKAGLVSLKHVSLLSSSFQFLILTCISPYLDKASLIQV
ncbi:hypothetical protein OSTOST_25313, partial [Ostertagia ostertagi]